MISFREFLLEKTEPTDYSDNLSDLKKAKNITEFGNILANATGGKFDKKSLIGAKQGTTFTRSDGRRYRDADYVVAYDEQSDMQAAFKQLSQIGKPVEFEEKASKFIRIGEFIVSEGGRRTWTRDYESTIDIRTVKALKNPLHQRDPFKL